MSNMQNINNNWEDSLKQIAVQAGEIIMSFDRNDLSIERKRDNSQVTIADKAADEYICAQLRKLSGDIPIISEEGEQQAGASTFWCVDPLDGTKGYINGGNEFTVNIALVHDGLPVIGVIYIPPTDALYYGQMNYGQVAQDENMANIAYRLIAGMKTKLQVRNPPAQGNRVILSHYHDATKQAELAKQFNAYEFLTASSSLKFCRIAEGIADIYPRFGNTMEWDTAAGHAILKAAGGRVMLMSDDDVGENNVNDCNTNINYDNASDYISLHNNMGNKYNSELKYGKQGFLNPHFVAFGGDMTDII